MSQQLKELAVQARGPEFRYPAPMQWTRRDTVHTYNPALRGPDVGLLELVSACLAKKCELQFIRRLCLKEHGGH